MILIVLLLVIAVWLIGILCGMAYERNGIRKYCPIAYEQWKAYLETRG